MRMTRRTALSASITAQPRPTCMTPLASALGRLRQAGVPSDCATIGGTVYYLRDLAGHTSVYTSNGVNQCHDYIYAGNRHLVTYRGFAEFVAAYPFERSVPSQSAWTTGRPVLAIPLATPSSAPLPTTAAYTARTRTSPAKNVTPRAGWITSARAIWRVRWAASCRLTRLR